MKINSITTTTIKKNQSAKNITHTSKPCFGGLFFKSKIIKDTFTPHILPPTKGLKHIKDIHPNNLGGTACKNSLDLKNFWLQFFESDDLTIIKKKGLSTNKDGYPDSFLKSTADKPLSTSFVHNCSVLYLFNKDTNTHFLYHAAPTCTKYYLDFIIKTFMKEGFSHGAINPGHEYWYKEHASNIHNMFDLMKKHNPKAIINLYHTTTPYPEVVGYKGQLFQIPNEEVKRQILIGMNPDDFGQASFKISDICGSNTTEKIKYNTASIKELSQVEKEILNSNYEPEIKSALKDLINEKATILREIENTNNYDELKELAEFYSYKNRSIIKAITNQSEKLLIKELKDIKTKDELNNYIQRLSEIPLINTMETLKQSISLKKHELYKIK